MKKRILAAFALLLVFGMQLIHLGDFAYLSKGTFSDITITHYPNLLYIKNSILEFGQIPLWSNMIYSGMPFAANPLSGLWYLPGWIAVLFPLPMGINISVILHILFGFVGMFLFLRANGRSEMASFVFGLALFPGIKLSSHLGAGHLTLVYAISWTPWVLLFTQKAVDSERWTKYSFTGICLGMLIAADIRWIIPAGFLWMIYAIWQFLNNKKQWFSDFAKYFLSNTSVALLISAAVWIPLVEFLQFSTRSGMVTSDNLVYSLGLNKLFGLFFPDFGGFAEWAIYPTMLVLFCSILTVTLYKGNKKERFWIVVALVFFILSLGSTLPFLIPFYSLPILNLVRVPSRYFFITLFSLIMLASFGFDYLILGRDKYKFHRLFFITPIISFILIFYTAVVFMTDGEKYNFHWAAIISLIVFLLIWLGLHSKFDKQVIGISLAVVLIVEIVGVNFFGLKYVSVNEEINSQSELMQILSSDQPSRVYTPSFAISQAEGAYWELNQINGVDPMQLSAYVQYFDNTSGVPHEKYSVTLPPFEIGAPSESNQGICPDIDTLEQLSVQYIVSNFSISECDGIENEMFIDNKYITKIDPIWARLSTKDDEISFSPDEVDLKKYFPNEIEFSMDGPGLLILSEIDYPGWKFEVNGQKISGELDDGLFRSVQLSEGENNIRLFFRPVSIYIGLFIEGIAWLTLILMWTIKNRKKN